MNGTFLGKWDGDSFEEAEIWNWGLMLRSGKTEA